MITPSFNTLHMKPFNKKKIDKNKSEEEKNNLLVCGFYRQVAKKNVITDIFIEIMKWSQPTYSFWSVGNYISKQIPLGKIPEISDNFKLISTHRNFCILKKKNEYYFCGINYFDQNVCSFYAYSNVPQLLIFRENKVVEVFHDNDWICFMTEKKEFWYANICQNLIWQQINVSDKVLSMQIQLNKCVVYTANKKVIFFFRF